MHASGPKADTIRGVDAMPADIASPLSLAPVQDQATLVDFEGGRWSSDGGLVLRNDPDDQLGLTRDLAAVLRDRRDPRRVDLTLHDLLQQRVWHMAAGDEEANEATTLRHDPLCKGLRGRLPESGPPVASPPPLSRGEHRVSRSELSRRARVLVDQWSASYARPPQRSVLDCADTEDPVHGPQEQGRYDGDDGGSGFVPRHVSAGLAGRLITTIVQAKRFSGAPRLAVWPRLGKRLRHAWPATFLIVRGARHVASPEGRQWLEAPAHLRAGTGLTSHAV